MRMVPTLVVAEISYVSVKSTEEVAMVQTKHRATPILL